MKFTKYIGMAALTLPMAAAAQNISFETEDYKAIGVYDTWEESPFRNGPQKLRGNAKVVDNPQTDVDDVLGYAPNATAKVLAVQRSRFGSNTFGARIDLKETFELTTRTRYVHVYMLKPVEGRVMLVGLGKRRERAGQSPEAEQFWVLSSTAVTPDTWCDAVFPIKGAGGIDIYSLVVVPDCESPHHLTQDFAAYIDEIEISDDPNPRFRRGDYILNFEEDETSAKADYYLKSVSLNGSADGNQTLEVGSRSPQLLYRPMLEKTFTAKAGETLTPNFSYSAGWMNGYVYLDRGNDGKFEYALNDDYTIPEGSDIMTYSYVETVENTEGYKSDGSKVSGSARNFINPPAFTVPADLPNGYYRMRFKVDWGNVDPGGNTLESQSIKKNGGMIVDVRMNIHGDVCEVTQGQLNGDVLAADGTVLNKYQTPFGKPFTIKMSPAPGFTYEGIRVRHGYNLSGDSLVHSTPQYVDVYYPAYLFRGDTLTLPAEVMDGEVRIEGYFVEKKDTPEADEDYPLNFDKALVNSHPDPERRMLRAQVVATKGGTSSIPVTTSAKEIYRDLRSRQVSVVPGDEVETTLTYQNGQMHAYLYVDLNQDGQFTVGLDADGRPTMASELLSYNYYDGRNSQGEAVDSADVDVNRLPAFTIPEQLPRGVYRARLKVDWDNVDPGGRYGKDDANSIDANAGYVLDFLLNVHGETQKLEVFTTNGSVNGANNTGLPVDVSCFTTLALVPTPVAVGYSAESMTIKHGHNFDGPQYIHGNRQWSEFTRSASNYTLPRDSVDGDVIITVNYEPTDRARYKLVFNDEFDAADGTQPDEEWWSRCVRQSSTWNRWLSDSEEVIYLQDGKLVARAIPNPDQTSDPVPMITGGIQSRGKFSFKYGKIEARILTNPHTGNFPAFWLMPEDQTDGWPTCGEIDIFEQIDNQNTAYHTVHSHWTYDLGHTSDPKSSYNESVQMDRYHTYGFEWDETQMRWYVDGKQVGTYRKSTDEDALRQGQWPFGKAFYIILNQSVGNGSWAANADVSHTYETLFDWVRVYQQNESVGISSLTQSDKVSVDVKANAIVVYADRPTPVNVIDAAGRSVWTGEVRGTKEIRLTKGIYMVNSEKVFVP